MGGMFYCSSNCDLYVFTRQPVVNKAVEPAQLALVCQKADPATSAFHRYQLGGQRIPVLKAHEII